MEKSSSSSDKTRISPAWVILKKMADPCGLFNKAKLKQPTQHVILKAWSQYMHKTVKKIQEKEKDGTLRPLRYCTLDQFFDCFCIFLKTYTTLVTSKICFLYVTF